MGRASQAELLLIGRQKMERLGVFAAPVGFDPGGLDVEPAKERARPKPLIETRADGKRVALPRHDPVIRSDRQVVDANGRPGAPWRTLDILAGRAALACRRRDAGELTKQEYAAEMALIAAGERFRALFRRAALDDLKAAALIRIGGGGAQQTNGNEAARHSIAAAIRALGGGTAPAASCVWHVVGLEWSLRRWGETHWNCAHNTASGVLLAGLGVLAHHFRLDRAESKT